MITVKQLIAKLKTYDPKRIVILSSDSEGNRLSPLADLGTAAYLPDSPSTGDIGLEALTPEDREQGYTQEDVIHGGKPALVLSPIC